MPYHSKDGIRYYVFDSLGRGALHAVFTRHGGVSPAPWASLNLGGTVGDDISRVRINRLKAFAALGVAPESMYDVWQVHGAHVIVAQSPRPAQSPLEQADGILTDRPGVTLFMRYADCVPVLLHDPLRQAVGLVHAGWLGTVRGAARAAVEAMQAAFGSKPADILAAIGPSIGPDHYQVGPDVVLQVRQEFGKQASGLFNVIGEGIFLDLWSANRLVLEQAGVHSIEVAGLCTACHVVDYYSHRLEHGRTGRFGALLALVE